jgi:hypothetical protein
MPQPGKKMFRGIAGRKNNRIFNALLRQIKFESIDLSNG